MNGLFNTAPNVVKMIKQHRKDFNTKIEVINIKFFFKIKLNTFRIPTVK